MGINKIAAYSSKSTIMEIFEEEHGKVDIEKNVVKAWAECDKRKFDLQLELSLSDLNQSRFNKSSTLQYISTVTILNLFHWTKCSLLQISTFKL